MIAVIQRINHATVYSEEKPCAKVGKGLYILLGVHKNDENKDAELLAEKISKLRIFSDENGKLNLSIVDINGEAIVVSNFTLNANYSHGNRPDFFDSAPPDAANDLYQYFVSCLNKKVANCQTGRFGTHMRTELSTDGPVTILMNSDLLKGKKNI